MSSEDSHSGLTGSGRAEPAVPGRPGSSGAGGPEARPAPGVDPDRTVPISLDAPTTAVTSASSAAPVPPTTASRSPDQPGPVPASSSGQPGQVTSHQPDPTAGQASSSAGSPPGAGLAAGSPPGGGAPVGSPPGSPAGRPGRRVWLVGGLAGVLALVLVVAGLTVVQPVADWLGATPLIHADEVDSAEPPPPLVLAPAAANAPAPTPDGVRAALAALLGGGALGDEVNISIVDPASGEVLFERGQETPTIPASTTKLVTAATVLVARGPAYRITTRVVAGAAPGEVVVVGAGDPTLAINGTGWYPGAGRLDRLAEQVKKALGGTKPTRVVIDGSLYPGPEVGPGWDSDATIGGFGAKITAFMTDGARINPRDPSPAQARYSDPALAAGRIFAKQLGLPPSAVTKGTAPAATGATGADPGGVPAPGTELGRVESPPLVRLVEFMLKDSDNVVAEALARQVALARGKPASFEGAAVAMDEVVAELGLPAEESDLADGSGLSRSNRLTPSLLTDLLTLAARGTRPELGDLFPGLPVAAWSGSLRDRFDATGGARPTAAGAGTVRAKTGTLSGVHAISGTVITADGRLLAFAILANKVPGSTGQARAALDVIAATLATCGCR